MLESDTPLAIARLAGYSYRGALMQFFNSHCFLNSLVLNLGRDLTKPSHWVGPVPTRGRVKRNNGQKKLYLYNCFLEFFSVKLFKLSTAEMKVEQGSEPHGLSTSMVVGLS